jgi:integrase
VPILRRVFYGFLAREGMRSSEALGLSWDDLDLKRGVVRLDENKTDDPRAWALSAGVVEALERVRETTAGELVFSIPNTGTGRVAEAFRCGLGAGGDRSARALRALEVTPADPGARLASNVRDAIARRWTIGDLGC